MKFPIRIRIPESLQDTIETEHMEADERGISAEDVATMEDLFSKARGQTVNIENVLQLDIIRCAAEYRADIAADFAQCEPDRYKKELRDCKAVLSRLPKS